jgi:hypothetical protein
MKRPAAGRAGHAGGRGPLPEGVPEPGDAVREEILRIWEAHPHWGPKQIRAELRLMTEIDVPPGVVEVVLAVNQGRRVVPG